MLPHPRSAGRKTYPDIISGARLAGEEESRNPPKTVRLVATSQATLPGLVARLLGISASGVTHGDTHVFSLHSGLNGTREPQVVRWVLFHRQRGMNCLVEWASRTAIAMHWSSGSADFPRRNSIPVARMPTSRSSIRGSLLVYSDRRGTEKIFPFDLIPRPIPR